MTGRKVIMGGWMIGFSVFLVALWSGLYRRIAVEDEEFEEHEG